MPRMNVKITGERRLLRALNKLPKIVAKKVIRQSLRKGAKPIHTAALANVPKDTGELKKSIKIRVLKVKKKGTYAIRVGSGKKDYQGDQFYGSFVEFGHYMGSRKLKNRVFVPAKPFLRPAYDTQKESSKNIIIREIKAGVERSVKEAK